MSRRRTGAIAIGVGALTAVVLSLVGAKTPVVIGSAAALGVAGGVVAGRKGIGKSADELMESGKSKLENKDFHGAIDDFNKLLDSHPYNADSYYNRGLAKAKLGNNQGAIEDYSKAIEINPLHAIAYTKRGNAKFDLKDHQGALIDCSKAIEIDDNNAEFFFNRGFPKLKLEDQEGTKSDWFKAAALGDKHASICLRDLFYSHSQSMIDAQSDDLTEVERHSRRCLLLEDFDPLEAIDGYLTLLSIEPSNAEHYISIGKLKRRIGDNEGALIDLSTAIELDPKSSTAYGERGLVKSIMEDYMGAINDYNHCLCVKREKVLEKRYQTFIKRLLGDLLRQNTDINPKDSLNYTYRAASKCSEGDYQGAIEDYTKALELDSKNSLAYMFRGACHDLSGDSKAALDDYSESIELNPSNADIYYTRGVTLRDSGDDIGALSDFTLTIKLDRWNALAYRNRGNLHFRHSELKSACCDWNEASDLGDEIAKGLLEEHCDSCELQTTSYQFAKLGDENFDDDYASAIDAYSKALEINPNVEIYLMRAAAKVELEDLEGAMYDYEKALEINPYCHDAYFYRGISKEDLGDYPGAIDDFTKAIDISPDIRSYMNRASLKSDLGDYQGAISDYTKVLEIDPYEDEIRFIVGAYNRRGEAKARINDREGALEDFTESIEIDPENIYAYINRILVKKELGDLNGACEDWKKAAELGNQYPYMKVRLENNKEVTKFVTEHCQ
ncbi:TPR repeat [Prochlorococcus marinus str. MIT 9313]|uniref:TPR repeat n=1 Tax=Prochlorococcus marinus (strain MIT 9313) TaxID=74547 RepID=Q7V8P1_PROMM|nr:tetratricopeptide repeat protein [Prochlorococcus marinus]CAE20470.1 TPR repeat [Prochlorococcus marinus str. MIT 9313]